MRFINELKLAIKNEDFYETNEILEKIKQEGDAFEYLSPLFKLMEANSDLEFGEPGPIVHFMEMFYRRGYEEMLLESITRQPTCQTIWMLNRILNDPNLEDKQRYINVLGSLLSRKDIPQNVMNEIEEFYKFQQRK